MLLASRDEKSTRWRCNFCGKTIVWKRDSIFANTNLPLRSLLIIIIHWLFNTSLSTSAQTCGTTIQSVIRFRNELKEFTQKHMVLYPKNFNRNILALIRVGKCVGNCLIFLICVGLRGDHNESCIYYFRKKKDRLLFVHISITITLLHTQNPHY